MARLPEQQQTGTPGAIVHPLQLPGFSILNTSHSMTHELLVLLVLTRASIMCCCCW